ncbi:MAG: flagellar basal body P-ring formation chaperone FlgA [Planctomycetota bacterium]
MNTIRCRTRSLLAAVAVLVAPTAAGADSIVLNSTAVLDSHDTTVTLGEIAELTGPDAEALFAVVVRARAGSETCCEISIADVRKVLSTSGAHWGRINLNGRSTQVRWGGLEGAQPPTAMQAVTLGQRRPARSIQDRESKVPEVVAPTADEFLGENSIRGQLASFFTRQLDVDPHDLRMDIRGLENDMLTTARDGLRLVVQPQGNIDNEIVELVVRAYRGARVADSWTLRVGLAQRTQALVATRPIRLGGSLSDNEHIEAAERWLAPRVAAKVVDRSVFGACTAASRIPEGRVLLQDHLASPTVVHRGDQVKVRCLVGGLEVTIDAEARSPGAAGDMIELRKIGEREVFTAVVAGSGEAIVDLSR